MVRRSRLVRKLSRREQKLVRENPLGDFDGDGIINVLDCDPFDSSRHGFDYRYSVVMGDLLIQKREEEGNVELLEEALNEHRQVYRSSLAGEFIIGKRITNLLDFSENYRPKIEMWLKECKERLSQIRTRERQLKLQHIGEEGEDTSAIDALHRSREILY